MAAWEAVAGRQSCVDPYGAQPKVKQLRLLLVVHNLQGANNLVLLEQLQSLKLV